MLTRQIGEIKYTSNYTSKYDSGKQYASLEKMIQMNIEAAEKNSPSKHLGVQSSRTGI